LTRDAKREPFKKKKGYTQNPYETKAQTPPHKKQNKTFKIIIINK
jgi:hypothetical protein